MRVILSWIKRVGDIIPEGALYVYEVSRLNYTYVWLFLFSSLFLFVSQIEDVILWKC